MYIMMRAFYLQDKDNIIITSNIHQNSVKDQLHISLRYTIPVSDKWNDQYTFHLYGILNGIFLLTHMTAQYKDKTETIVEFLLKE